MSRYPALAMPDVLIVTDSGVELAVRSRMAAAFERAILAASTADVEIETDLRLRHKLAEGTIHLSDRMLCPLTFDVPETLEFPQKRLYSVCRDVVGLRQRVKQDLEFSTGTGRFWLPIVLTAKGALYAEVIAPVAYASPTDHLGYLQPFHLPDRQRQPLYQLGRSLLKLLAATPAVYLIQFGFQGVEIVFDRVFPFPAAPAIASITTQLPDLFACHWYCLNNQAILDLMIGSIK